MKSPDRRYVSNWLFAVQAACVFYVFFALFCYLPMRAAHFEFKAAVADSVRLSQRDRSEEVLKRKVLDNATKLGIPVDANRIEVYSKSDFCHVKLSYDRDLRIPPFATTLHYEIDHAVRRF